MRSMRVRFSGETNIGLKRAHNEDNFFLPEDERLAIVADGMGGHASGEVASKMAVETVAEHFTATTRGRRADLAVQDGPPEGYEENRLITGIKLANLRIYETRAARRAAAAAWAPPSSRRCSSTTRCSIGHVGDSRVYRLRDGKLEQLTEDHSLLNDYIKMKRLTPEEIGNFPHKNVIVRALGMKETVKVDMLFEPPALGDIVPAVLATGCRAWSTTPGWRTSSRRERPRHGVRAADPRRQPQRRAATTSPACWLAWNRCNFRLVDA